MTDLTQHRSAGDFKVTRLAKPSYLVRLFIEPEDIGFLWREFYLPFVPFKDLHLRMKDSYASDWWDEFTVVRVEWIVSAERFQCGCIRMDSPGLDSKAAAKVFLDNGWKELGA